MPAFFVLFSVVWYMRRGETTSLREVTCDADMRRGETVKATSLHVTFFVASKWQYLFASWLPSIRSKHHTYITLFW